MRKLCFPRVCAAGMVTLGLSGCGKPGPSHEQDRVIVTPAPMELFQGAITGNMPEPVVPTPTTVDLKSLLPEDAQLVGEAEASDSETQLEYTSAKKPVEALAEITDRLKEMDFGCELREETIDSAQVAGGLCRSGGAEITVEARRAANENQTLVVIRARYQEE